jgi:Xaa-Pro aminopeptidase
MVEIIGRKYMIKNRIEFLRKEIKQHGFSGYIIPARDEYLSEYAPAYAKRLEYISSFTGSNGIVIVLEQTVLFFTDGRYITQCISELDDHIFEIFDQQLISGFDWNEFVESDEIIAYDPKLFTNMDLRQFASLNLKPHKTNLVDTIWQEQPQKPCSKIYNYPQEYAGESWEEKINKCREFLIQHNAESLLITDSASVCWLFNIRADDIEFSPLLLANAIVTREKIYLFTEQNRFETNVIRDGLEIVKETEFDRIIAEIGDVIIYDDKQCSSHISSLVKKREHKNISNPCMLWKACKNRVEIEHMKQMHIQDAVAVCEILAFIANGNLDSISEYDIGLKLAELRSKEKSYIYDSFATICGFQDNGAMMHYRADEKSAKKIAGHGLLLLDSGGQYMGATTDITRTVSVGAPKQEHRKFYTTVLKGHIALAMARFPSNKITGANLDILARQYLWQKGLDYPHGTGHGVGNCLSVHEGPQSISLHGYGAKMQTNMVVSNEPGYYLPGEFGIRIENMMYTKESGIEGFLDFEMLTLVPYEKQLIDFEMLDNSEIDYIKAYYKKIESCVRSRLSDNAKKWLDTQIMLNN